MAKTKQLKSDRNPIMALPEEPSHIRKDDEQEIQYINLKDILPSPTNPRQHFDQAKLEELALSITKYGVIQPITIRAKKGMDGKFELVCGECRWKASTIAQRLTIPSIIRDLSDDEVLDLQFAENLDRQDVHAMDEAVTFKRMLNTGRYTTLDIAAKVNKGESFVAQRLSLNSLSSEFQKDFWEDKFLIGHAILFSRLTVLDQKELYKRFGGRNNYDTLAETRDYIDRNIIRKLSAAPFKRDDAELVPFAGPCTTCLKRSGCNTSLFIDYSDDDRCFDQGCFEKKVNAFVIRKAKITIESNPEILLIEGGHYGDKLDPAVKKAASDMKVKIFDTNSEIRSWASTGYVPVKALMVSGTDAGKVKTVYVPGKGKNAVKGKTSKRTAEHVQDEIDGVKDRQKRALELDQEKIWEKTKGMIDKPALLKELIFDAPEVTECERNAMATAIILEIPSGEYREAAAKVVGIKGEFFYLELEQAKKIKGITNNQVWHLLRLLMLATLKNSGHPDKSAGPTMLMPVLKMDTYLGQKFTTIEDAQLDEAEKRIARADNRIAVLKAEKKELEGKKATKGKPAVTSKGIKGKKNFVDMSDEELDEQVHDDE